MKIIIIDDEAEALRFFIQALSEELVYTLSVRTPEGARRIFEESTELPDAIILDIMMPEQVPLAEDPEGHKTGIRLIEPLVMYYRRMLGSNSEKIACIPLAVLTKVSDPDILADLDKTTSAITGLCCRRWKKTTKPKTFARELVEFVDQTTKGVIS